MGKKNFGDLEFVRITMSNAFKCIPIYLLEQIKDCDFSIQQLMRLGLSVCADPLVYIFALVDAENIIKGVLWSRVDYVDEILEVHLLSVDEEYQGGNTIGDCLAFLRRLQETERPKLLKGCGIRLKEKIRYTTNRPAVFEKAGFTRSKRVIMEIRGEDAPQTDQKRVISDVSDLSETEPQVE